MVVVGLTLAAALVLLGLGTAARQRHALARLRAERFLPSDDRTYLRGQVRRRVATGAVLVMIGGLIAGYYLSGMDARMDEIVARERNAAPVPEAEDRADKDFARLVAGYWSGVLVLVFAAGCLAVFDFWATRRYWMAQYKLLKADHEVKLQRDLAVYRQAKDNDRMHRLRGNPPPGDGDTDEQPPV
ncbi:MAG TPA: hypothetical protein VH092_34910 [Urbifossiella sp.]|nr:hypothetical protein [Urbifossiella sp.]